MKGLSKEIHQCPDACPWVLLWMPGKGQTVCDKGMTNGWASGEAWWVPQSVHVPWDKQKIAWSTAGSFCGVKLRHLPGAEPADRDDYLRGQRLWMSCLCSTCELLPKNGGTLCSAWLTCVKIKIRATIISLNFSVTLKFAAQPLSLHKGPKTSVCIQSFHH